MSIDDVVDALAARCGPAEMALPNVASGTSQRKGYNRGFQAALGMASRWSRNAMSGPTKSLK
jgi:hypothetical protein